MYNSYSETHLKTRIDGVINKLQWGINSKDVRYNICRELEYLFNFEFEYWCIINDLHVGELKFVDLTTVEMINRGSYHIGVSIRGEDPIAFYKFIKEYVEIDSIRDKIRDKVIEDILRKI